MATLLDRYLDAVEKALPSDVAKADVVAEIRDELESQIESREAESGRPLTEDEEVPILRTYGHPRVVAARYGRVQYLIGPDLFPFYWSTMRNVLAGGVALVLAAGGLASIFAHNGTIFFDTLGIAWNTAWWIAVVVTIMFAVAERVPRNSDGIGRFTRTWDPRRLPVPDGLPPVNRFSALIEFVVNFMMVLVLLDVRTQHIPLDALVANILSAAHATLTSAWHPAYIATIAGSAIVAGSALAAFLRPHLAFTQEVLRIVASGITAVGLCITLVNGPWFIAASSGWNTWTEYGLIAVIIAMSINIITSLRGLRRTTRATALPCL
jgi:hypothetical protein